MLLLWRRLPSCGNGCVCGFGINVATTTFSTVAVDGSIDEDNDNDNDDLVFAVGDDVVVIGMLSKLTTTFPAAAASAAGGGEFDNRHGFCCSLDSFFSVALDATTVTVLNIFQ
jgi:hypothetical protein